MKKSIELIIITGLVVAISACGSTQPKSGIIAKEWSDNTRQLGITPIFPPRERVYPGDVYISRIYDPKTAEDAPATFYNKIPYRYDHINLDTELNAEASDNRLMPAMANFSAQGSNTETWALPTHNAPSGKRLNGLVAFPGFTFASFSESDLGFNITNGAWGALFGGGRKSKYMVSYTIPAAEYISVELKTLLPKILDYRDNLGTEQREDIHSLAAALGRPQDKEDPAIGVIILYEVFYARSIDVTITSNDASGVNGSAVLASMVELGERKKELQKQLLVVGEIAPPTDSGSNVKTQGNSPQGEASAKQNSNTSKGAQLQQEITLIQKEIAALSQAIIPNAPGVTGSITRSSTNGVTLTQSFYYPIAIGFRALMYDVKQFTNIEKKPKPKADTIIFLKDELKIE